jgi:hypothetical protein
VKCTKIFLTFVIIHATPNSKHLMNNEKKGHDSESTEEYSIHVSSGPSQPNDNPPSDSEEHVPTWRSDKGPNSKGKERDTVPDSPAVDRRSSSGASSTRVRRGIKRRDPASSEEEDSSESSSIEVSEEFSDCEVF